MENIYLKSAHQEVHVEPALSRCGKDKKSKKARIKPIHLFSRMPLENRAPQSHPAHTPRQLIFLSDSIRIRAAIKKTC
jgi:hypothetical protein